MRWTATDLEEKGYRIVNGKACRLHQDRQNSCKNGIIINDIQSHSPDVPASGPMLTTVSVKEIAMANDNRTIPPMPRTTFSRPKRHYLRPDPSERASYAAMIEAARQMPPTPAINLVTYPTRLSHVRIVAHCTVPGNPGVKGRPRFVKATGEVYTPKSTKRLEHDIGWIVKQAQRELVVDDASAFGLRLVFYVRDGQRKDIDNMAKVVFDGITGIVWDDDCQVREMMVWSVEDAIHPRTEILIYKLGFEAKTFHTCEVCHQRFRVYPSWTDRRYCSRKCSSFAQRNRILRSCAQCGTLLEYISSYVNKLGHYFCSATCTQAHRTQQLTCAQCQTPFRRPNSWVRKGQNSFCSAVCRDHYWKEHRVSPAVGLCRVCNGPTTRKEYTICVGCRRLAVTKSA